MHDGSETPRANAPGALPAALAALVPARASLCGLSIALDAEAWPATAVAAILSGRYEQSEARLVRSLVAQGAGVVEAGTAIGFVAMCAARAAGPGRVTTFDGNPTMTAMARANFAANGIAAEARNGVLHPRAHAAHSGAMREFHVAADFLVSSLEGTARPASGAPLTSVRVPTWELEAVLSETGASTLVVDIEGGEADLLADADLDAIDTLILELHPAVIGSDACMALAQSLSRRGLVLDPRHFHGHVAAFRRGGDSPGEACLELLSGYFSLEAEAPGRPGEAIAGLAALSQAWPECPFLAVQLAARLLAADRDEEAAACARRAAALDGDMAEPKLMLARIDLRARKPQPADTAMCDLTASQPGLADAWYWRGRAAMALRHLPAARQHLQHCLTLNPLARNAHKDLAQVCRRLGDNAAATHHDGLATLIANLRTDRT